MSKIISGIDLLKFTHIGSFIIEPSQLHNAVLEKMIVKAYCANQYKKNDSLQYDHGEMEYRERGFHYLISAKLWDLSEKSQVGGQYK